MSRTGLLLLLVLSAPAAAQEQLFDLTLNRLLTEAELARLNDLVELPDGFLDTLRRDGFAQRVVPVRPGIDPASLLSLGEVPGVAFATPGPKPLPFGNGAEWSGGNITLSHDGTDLFASGGALTFDRDQGLTLWPASDQFHFPIGPGPTLVEPDGSLLLFPGQSTAAMFQDLYPELLPNPDEPSEVTVQVASGEVPHLAAGSLRETASRMTVTQGLPEGITVVQETAGQCTSTTPPDWPFSIDHVAGVIAFGNEVLAEAMLNPPVRARILVVDSGLPPALLANPDFLRLIDINRREAMGAGAFARNAEEASEQKGCRDLDRDPGASLYGFVPLDEGNRRLDAHCQPAEDPIAAIAPPLPDSQMQDYDPAHGAMVAGLASGGPDLIRSVPDLQQHLAISMARIARAEVDGNRQHVASSVNDALGGIKRAAEPFDGSVSERFSPQEQRFDILSLSLSVERANFNDRITGALETFISRGGLVVVAAGNGPPGGAPHAIDQFAGSGVPTAGGALAVVLGTADHFDGAIVVGGTAPATEGIVPYERSNWSPRIVDIAAPATGVASFGIEGDLACTEGTSVATPQVSFVAAMLVSFGLWSNAEVKHRILATADLVPALAGRVRDGRVLNVAAALDVFSDLVWMRDPSRPNGLEAAPRRLRILDLQGHPNGTLLLVCDDGSDKFIDTRELILWERMGSRARLWRSSDDGGITPYDGSCKASSGAMLPVIDLETGSRVEIPIDDIARIVPSRFRLGRAVLRTAGVQ